MLRISKHANSVLGPRDVGKLHRPAETFVLLRIIILKPNLQLNRLREFAPLCFGIVHNRTDGIAQNVALELAAEMTKPRYDSDDNSGTQETLETQIPIRKSQRIIYFYSYYAL